MGYHCCFKNCSNTNRKTNCRFFRFPVKDKERSSKWIERSGNASLLQLSAEMLITKFICSAHFDVDQILGTGRLFYNSIPNAYDQPAKNPALAPAEISSNSSAESNSVPPFIIIYETLDFVVDLIDEDDVSDDVDEDDVMSQEGHAIEDFAQSGDMGPVVEAPHKIMISNDESADESENVEEFDPLAMETEDSLLTLTNSDALSTAAAFNDDVIYQRDHSVTEVFHIIETVMDSEITPSTGDQSLDNQATNTSTPASSPLDDDQETSETACVIEELQKYSFLQLSSKKKKEIMAVGRPMPTITLTGPSQIHFGKDQYDRYTWLTGSSVLKKLFCWPCLLFYQGTKGLDWTHKGFDDDEWLTDIKLHKHENSKAHMHNSVQFAIFKNTNKKDLGNVGTTTHNEKVEKNRDILQRMIDAVCLLAKMKIPFRSGYDTNASLLHGTYVGIITSLSEYDHLLRNHFETPGVNSLTCSKIRNDLIVAIGARMIKEIKEEVKESKFASIILYQPSGTMSGSQLSSAVRYIGPEGIPCERFIRYENIGSGTGTYERGLELVARIVEEFDIQSKLVAVSYSGQLIELCSDIKERYPNVLVINNHTEKLHSDLVNVCSGIKECHLYLATMSSLEKFFSDKTTEEKFQFFMKNKFPGVKCPKVYSTSCCWKTICNFLPHILAFFKNILENHTSWPVETVLKAQGYQYFFEDFSNIFLLVLFARVFAQTEELSEFLQTRDFNLGLVKVCLIKVQKTETSLETDVVAFDELWENVKMKRKNCNLEPEPPALKRKTLITYSRKQSNLEDPQNTYKLLFSKIIACISSHISDLWAYVERLHLNTLLNLKEVERSSEFFSWKSLEVLLETYPRLFHREHIKEQLSVLYQTKQLKNISQLDLIPHMKSNDILNVIPEVYTLACLCATIPGAKQSKESFSATHRIKYVLETLGQHQLSNLALLSIENHFLSQLKKQPGFYKKVLEEFARLESSAEFTYL